jgi:metallo-beta-lactamase family protein
MKLSFHGADRGVTGSCHLVECGGRRVLIDCGMLQGSRELDEENAQGFGFDPPAIDYLLLTHAHLDHCGRLPLLVRQGFRGEVITTAASRELARLVLMDSAHLQEEDARHRSRATMRRSGGSEAATPLYSMLDALGSFDRFGRIAEYGKPLAIATGMSATFLDAGHILGSASILLELDDGGRRRSLLFSGDLGNAERPLFAPPVTPPSADVIVMESTYGDRVHRSYRDSVEEMLGAILNTFLRGGNVVIPTFALERAQEILFALRRGIDANRLPPSTPVFLDSPMAVSATEIFERHPECYGADVARLFGEGQDPFQVPGLHLVRETADSVAINKIAGGAIIMAGSGMCTGGRVRHHLRHNLWRAESSIVFVGYAAKGTPARVLIDGAEHIRLFGEDIPVRARIHTINGFSAHADQDELVSWHQRIEGKAVTFLVHGEEKAMRLLANRLADTRVEMPTLHQSFDL